MNGSRARNPCEGLTRALLARLEDRPQQAQVVLTQVTSDPEGIQPLRIPSELATALALILCNPIQEGYPKMLEVGSIVGD